MSTLNALGKRPYLAAAAFGGAAVLGVLALARFGAPGNSPAQAGEGGAARSTKQPCTVEAFERVDLVPLVSGYLTSQAVDLGDRVQKGQALAGIASPGLEAGARQAAAAVKQARGRAREAEARVPVAQQAVLAARAAVVQRQAEVDGANAGLAARQAQLERFRKLAQEKSVDQKLVEEKE
jgi:multidrug efflux pump subunit AcrA (membrane-fusion protein)